MKKIFTLLLVSFNFIAYSQDTLVALQNSKSQKSGNFQDVLTGFYQLALKSGIDKKNIEANFTLFALARQYDKNIFIDASVSRSRIYFLRNFQVSGKVNLTESFDRVTGYTGGFKYAIINGRDKEFLDYRETLLAVLFREFQNLAIPVIIDLNDYPSEDITAVLNSILNQRAVPSDLTHIDAAIRPHLDRAISSNSSLSRLQLNDGTYVKDTNSLMKYLDELDQKYLEEIAVKPLWTISADATADTDGVFEQASVESVFLMGGKKGELDARARFSYADTLDTGTIRTNLNAKLGYNFKFQDKTGKASFFEIKAYGEYNRILRNPLPDEEEDTFLANAEIRLRLTDDLWLPFTIKYDIENANVLGFLNITYNFGDD
jgi:hypothetical protein